MVCGDGSGDAAYGKIMKFIHYPKRYAILFKHIPYSPHISKHISKVVCGGLGWFAVVYGGLRWFAVPITAVIN